MDDDENYMKYLNGIITDAEFVYLSDTKNRIIDTIRLFIIGKTTDQECFPYLEGKVYFLVVHEEPYCMTILVRYVDVNINLQAENKIEHELEKIKNIYSPNLIKDNGTLMIETNIKKMALVTQS